MALTFLVLAWLLTYLVHSTMLLGGAWVLSATRIVRSPAVRDTLWKVCLVGGILTATVYSLFPYQPYSLHVLLPGVTQPAPAAAFARAEPPVTWAASARPVAAGSGAAVAPIVRRAPAAGPEWSRTASPIPNPQSPTPSWPRLLLGLWLVGALAFVVRLLVLRLRLRRSLSRRREISDGPLAVMLDSLRARAGVRRRPRLTASAELAGPVAIGASEICLPERALTALDPAQQRAVLAHELGHLVRQDPLWLGVAAACESLFFFQPLNRLARRRIQEAAEYLCDDWAVHQTGGSLTLAKCLAEVATWMDAGSQAVPVAGMAENPSQLVDRVHRLLEGAQPSTRGFRVAVPVAALALSSMAFAAPGVSPPCDQEAQVSQTQRAPSAARAAWQGGHETWATIRGGRVLTFRDGFAPRLTGRGHLGIRRGGRMIELGDGQRLLVNGREPSDGRVIQVCDSDSLRIVDRDGATLWQLEPVRVWPGEALASAASAASSAGWSSAAARAGSAMEQTDDAMDSADDEADTADVEMEPVDAAQVAEIVRSSTEISRAATEISHEVTSQITSSVLPQVAQLQEMGVRLGGVLAPRLAGVVVGEVVPAIVQGLRGLCDGGLCDDSTPHVKRGKVLIKRSRP